MSALLPDIRQSARAIILRPGQILMLRKQDEAKGERYTLPGGAQDVGESLPDALRRECQEEIGALVAVGRLLHVAEFFKDKSGDPPARRHVVDFLFSCHLPDDYQPRNGPKPDKSQADVVWVPLQDLPKLTLDPRYLRNCLPPTTAERTLYLGCFDG